MVSGAATNELDLVAANRNADSSSGSLKRTEIELIIDESDGATREGCSTKAKEMLSPISPRYLDPLYLPRKLDSNLQVYNVLIHDMHITHNVLISYSRLVVAMRWRPKLRTGCIKQYTGISVANT